MKIYETIYIDSTSSTNIRFKLNQMAEQGWTLHTFLQTHPEENLFLAIFVKDEPV